MLFVKSFKENRQFIYYCLNSLCVGVGLMVGGTGVGDGALVGGGNCKK